MARSASRSLTQWKHHSLWICITIDSVCNLDALGIIVRNLEEIPYKCTVTCLHLHANDVKISGPFSVNVYGNASPKLSNMSQAVDWNLRQACHRRENQSMGLIAVTKMGCGFHSWYASTLLLVEKLATHTNYGCRLIRVFCDMQSWAVISSVLTYIEGLS